MTPAGRNPAASGSEGSVGSACSQKTVGDLWFANISPEAARIILANILWRGVCTARSLLPEDGASDCENLENELSSITIFLMTSLNWCQALQPQNWLLERLWLSGRVTSLSTKMISFALGIQGCLVVATVTAPPAVVCFK